MYEIYAIRYGHLERTATHNFLGGDEHDGPMPLDYYVWAIVGAGRTIVLDTGFDAATGAARGRTLVRPVATGLAALDIDPTGVRDVIVSHMHYDHAGNHDLFPQARYHLQDAEMAYCTGRSMCHGVIRAAFEARSRRDPRGGVYHRRPLCSDAVIHRRELHPGLTRTESGQAQDEMHRARSSQFTAVLIRTQPRQIQPAAGFFIRPWIDEASHVPKVGSGTSGLDHHPGVLTAAN